MNIKYYTYYTLIFLLSFVVSCKDKEEKKEYYADGSIKRILEIENGKLNGKQYTFYPNGATESISHWKEDKQDGLEEVFHTNGKLRTRAFWKNDRMNGLFEEFHENGKIFSQLTKKDNVTIGKAVFYDKNGNLQEVHLNNNEGQLIYLIGYIGGKVDTSTPIPLIEDNPDTVRVGQTFQTKIHFGYPLKGNVKVFVGHLNKTNELEDTTTTLYPDEQGAFYFNSVAKKAGASSIHLKFHHLPEPDDTISIHNLVTRHSYFVKN